MPVLEVLTAALCLTGGVALDALAAGFVLGPFLEALRVGLLLEALLDSAASPVLRHLLSILYLTQRSIVQFVALVCDYFSNLAREGDVSSPFNAARKWLAGTACTNGCPHLHRWWKLVLITTAPSVQKQLWLAVLTAPPLTLLSPSFPLISYSHLVTKVHRLPPSRDIVV